MLSSNLVKSNYIAYDEQMGARVIDSNKLIEAKIQQLIQHMEDDSAESLPSELVEDLDARQVARLLGEDVEMQDSTDKSSMARAIAQQATAEAKEIEAGAHEKADAILADAKQEAKNIVNTAIAEAEEIKKNAAKEGHGDGYKVGYAEAMQKNTQIEKQLHEQQEQLMKEYHNKMEELEPLFVDTLTGIYEHIFNIQFADNKDIVFHLIQDAVRKIEGSKDFIIRVSKEDYGYVSMQKKVLLAGVAHAGNVEIIEDITMESGQCMIETGGGIFDCGLGTQLAGLTKELKLLSYKKE